jgi:hypothetical protein
VQVALARGDPGQHVGLLAEPTLVGQHGRRAADHLGGRVTEQSFGTAVPRGHRAVQVGADDRIVAVLHHGGQRGPVALGQVPGGPLPRVGHVEVLLSAGIHVHRSAAQQDAVAPTQCPVVDADPGRQQIPDRRGPCAGRRPGVVLPRAQRLVRLHRVEAYATMMIALPRR